MFRNSGQNNVDHIKNEDRTWSAEKNKNGKNLNQNMTSRLSLITRYITRESFANAENTVKAQVLL
jgi:hypothetical protein